MRLVLEVTGKEEKALRTLAERTEQTAEEYAVGILDSALNSHIEAWNVEEGVKA